MPIVSPPAKLGLALWGTEPVSQLVAHARLAEEIGFESVWVIDSQLLCRELYITLGAIAAATSRIRIGPGVTQPATRHVSVTASAIATLQEIAGGRAMLGIGVGFSSLRTLGRGPARIAELEAYVGDIRQLLRGDSVTFENAVAGRLSWCEGPVSVPVHIAASGPRMTRSAARLGDGAILLQGVSPNLVSRGLGWIADGARLAGKDPKDIEVSCWAGIGLDDDPVAARDQVRARAAAGIKNADPDLFEGDERAAILRLKQDYEPALHASPVSAHSRVLPDSLIERYALAGTPQELRTQLSSLRSQAGLHRVILTPQVPGPGALPVDRLLHRLAKDVLPYIT